MVRLFIALEISDEVKEKIRGIRQVLLSSRARISVVNPDILHLTLKFLGEVGENRVGEISDAIQPIRFEPFDFAVGKVSANNPRRPRVIWCKVIDHGESVALNRRIEEALEPLGFPKEGRAFTPHITLARVKEYDPTLLPVLESLKDAEFGRSLVEGFALKKSTLTPKGPIYESLLEVGP